MKKYFLLPILLLLFPLFAGDLNLYGIEIGKTNIFEATEKLVKNEFSYNSIVNGCPFFLSKDLIGVGFSYEEHITSVAITTGHQSTVSEIKNYLETIIDSTITNYNTSDKMTTFNITGDKYFYYVEITPDFELSINTIYIQALLIKDTYKGIAAVGGFVFGATKEEVIGKLKKDFPLSEISSFQKNEILIDMVGIDDIKYEELDIITKLFFIFEKNKLTTISIGFPSIPKEAFYKIINTFINNYDLSYNDFYADIFNYKNDYGNELSYSYRDNTSATLILRNHKVLLY